MANANNLVILTFDGSSAAAAVYEQIEQMEKQGLVEVQDAIVIERDETESLGTSLTVGTGSGQAGSTVPVSSARDDEIRVVQTHRKKGKYAAGGAGIGLLAGVLLGGPIGGLIVGAGLGAVTGAMKDFGIDNTDIEVIRARLQPGTSALLLLGHVTDRDAFVAKLRSYDPKVISTSLTPELEKELRDRLSA